MTNEQMNNIQIYEEWVKKYGLKIPYDPNAKSPMFDKWLQEIIPKEDERELLQEWFAYHFMEDQPLKKAMFITHAPASGMTSLINVLAYFVGKSKIIHWTLDDLGDRFMLPNLVEVVSSVVIDAHPPKFNNRQIEALMNLTGRMPLMARRIRQKDPFQFRNNAKLTFVSNSMPSFKTDAQRIEALSDRFFYIELPNTIPEEERTPLFIDQILEKEYSGILNWILEGYTKLEEKLK